MGEDRGVLAFQEQQAVNDQKKSERASKKGRLSVEIGNA